MKNKKGFTLIELIAVIVILIVLMVIAVLMVNKNMDRTKLNTFLKEANTFAKGALAKESVDREDDLALDDIFHNQIYGKVCYSVSDKILGKYVSKTDNKYYGSIEVCYGPDCTYQTKIWITDGKHYIDGLSDPKNTDQVTSRFTSEYPYSCGQQAIGGGNAGGTMLSADFDYTGGEQKMDILLDGVYALEAWGAQSGNRSNNEVGGLGGYSYTEVELHTFDKLYINVGQQGGPTCPSVDNCKNAYNGGARGGIYVAGGGGATHIATKSGELRKVPVTSVYIVAGGGASPAGSWSSPEFSPLISGGGYCVGDSCGKFGAYGGFDSSNDNVMRGRGGGYSSYNGNWNEYNNDRTTYGGTGYVSNPNTRNGKLYCYNCNTTAVAYSVSKTTASGVYSEEPLPTYAKVGNGYARITYIGDFTE